MEFLHKRDGYRCTEVCSSTQRFFLVPFYYGYLRVLYPHVGRIHVVNKLTNTINQNRSGSLLKMYTCVPQLYYPGTSLHTYRTLIGLVFKRSHVTCHKFSRPFQIFMQIFNKSSFTAVRFWRVVGPGG
jgi:hypothetical protein